MQHIKPVHVIGGGLAGSEAAWQLAHQGVPVVLHEMRPTRDTFAHQTHDLAELVCSNSFRSDDHEYNAVGLIHHEMRQLNSIVMKFGDECSIPAGGALAVDRREFSGKVSKILEAHPCVTIKREEITEFPDYWARIIVASGPLTSPALTEKILEITGRAQLSFFDAIAPIVHQHSIDMSSAWFQSRYDKGTGTDYINCPMTKEHYHDFIDALLDAEKTTFKQWEKDTPYFEGCLPIEVMAERGRETLRFGPMKPVGLTNPHVEEKPYAVVQLRMDNKLGTLWNMVGFQTKMKYGAQVDVFRSIPGLEKAEFARLGGIHCNTFINSPCLLDARLRLKADPRIRFAGQITGVEGYVESAAIGLITGRMTAAECLGNSFTPPPATTALGALLSHLTKNAEEATFQPMNVNFGLFPPPEVAKGKDRLKGRDRKLALTTRAKQDMAQWLKSEINA